MAVDFLLISCGAKVLFPCLSLHVSIYLLLLLFLAKSLSLLQRLFHYGTGMSTTLTVFISGLQLNSFTRKYFAEKNPEKLLRFFFEHSGLEFRVW